LASSSFPVPVSPRITLYDAGFDFADALHVESSGNATRFATFDQRLAKITAGHFALEVFCP
jgi:hypothetical protein